MLVTGGKKALELSGMASSGLPVWSFTTDSLDLIRSRWQAYSGDAGTVFKGSLPPFGKVRALTITSPSGIAIEVIEPLDFLSSD